MHTYALLQPTMPTMPCLALSGDRLRLRSLPEQPASGETQQRHPNEGGSPSVSARNMSLHLLITS